MFYILDHKNKESIRYYFHLGNFTIFACKSNVYDDVCLILEKLGLPYNKRWVLFNSKEDERSRKELWYVL